MPVAEQTAAAILEGLSRLGMDRTSLGLARLTNDDELAALWTRAISLTGRRTLPLEVGLVLPLGAMGAIDYLASSALTVGAALTISQQLFPLVGPGLQFVIESRSGGGHCLSFVAFPPYSGQAQSDAFVLGVILGRLRLFASRPIDFSLVELTDTDPGPPAPWKALLSASRVRFGSKCARIHLRPGVWSIPLRGADPRLYSVLQNLVGVDQHASDVLLIAVRTLATQRLPSLLDLDMASSALGMSRRTLQRRLSLIGTSLESIVDQVRRDRASQLVAAGSLSLGEVASRVGFSEPASLTRAWKRWFSTTPSQWVAAQSPK